MHQYLHIGRGHVLHLAHLYLALLGSLQYGVYEGRRLRCRTCGLAKGNLRDGQSLVVTFLYLSSHTYRSTSLTIVVSAYINTASCGEVGI